MPMKELSKIRKSKHLTQAQLADMAGVNQGTIAKIEGNPDYNFTADLLYQLAAALKVEPAELIGLPDLHARAISALGAISDPDRQAAALVVLESMASKQAG